MYYRYTVTTLRMHADADAVCATVCINTTDTATVLYRGLQHGILYHTEALYTTLYAVLCVCISCIACMDACARARVRITCHDYRYIPTVDSYTMY